MKVLITGGSGQLGKSLRTVLEKKGTICVAPSHSEMDITDQKAVDRVIKNVRPDVVIHTAAYTCVDLAETQKAECWNVNVSGTQNVASASARTGAYLISISTDYVFDGRSQSAYQPFDTKSPLSVYGRSKAEGEEIVLMANKKNVVLRTAWLFGQSPDNFVQAILRAARKNSSIQVVSDQIGNPTYAYDLAELIAKLIKIQPSGIIHGTNAGVCSRAEYAREIIRLAGIDCSVREVLSADYPSPAKRPLHSALSNAGLMELGLSALPAWQDALKRYLGQINN